MVPEARRRKGSPRVNGGHPAAANGSCRSFFSTQARDSGSLQLCHLQRQETKITAWWQDLSVRQTLLLLTILLFAPYHTIVVKKSKVGIRSVPISGNDQTVLLILPNMPCDFPHTETSLQGLTTNSLTSLRPWAEQVTR